MQHYDTSLASPKNLNTEFFSDLNRTGIEKWEYNQLSIDLPIFLVFVEFDNAHDCHLFVVLSINKSEKGFPFVSVNLR